MTEHNFQGRGGAERDLEAAGIVLPALIGAGYGIFGFVKYGVDTDTFLRSYVPLIGGVTAAASAVLASHSKRLVVGLSALPTLLPWAFGVYLTLYLGVYGLYLAISQGWAVWGLVGSIAWIGIGFRMLNKVSSLVSVRVPT